ncbi:MAG TPA: quinone oxidoreductase [Bryobacteraceae bacterium]|nr:quinone oxidoreductase [Bryobacteraceae bacterium]
MRAVYIEEHGGAEALKHGDFGTPAAAAGQALVKVAISGVNFIDVYHRKGLYKLPLPAVLGTEGAGTIEAIGDGVAGFKPGDRVAWTMARGSYAEYSVVPATALVHVPEYISLRDAAASMLQGMTAHYLTHSTFPLEKGQTALVHAAAGGTGRLIVQMAKLRGARVIATAGSPAKAKVAREAGADEVILYNDADFHAEVKRLTDGAGVHVVYDGVGQATFDKGINSLRPRGMMVCFGNASGPIPPIDLLILSAKGSLFLTRPTLGNYSSPQELAWRSGDVFSWIKDGRLKLMIEKEYPLAETAQAQRDLEGRGTMGKLLITI